MDDLFALASCRDSNDLRDVVHVHVGVGRANRHDLYEFWNHFVRLNSGLLPPFYQGVGENWRLLKLVYEGVTAIYARSVNLL